MFEAALGTALAFIFLFGYLGFRRVAGYAFIVDIGCFVLCVYMFQGTYAGMMTGIIAGLVISVFLKLIRWSIGYQVVALETSDKGLPTGLTWKDIAPTRGAS